MLNFFKEYGKNLFAMSLILTAGFFVIYAGLLLIMFLMSTFGPHLGMLFSFIILVMICVAVFTVLDMSTR